MSGMGTRLDCEMVCVAVAAILFRLRYILVASIIDTFS